MEFKEQTLRKEYIYKGKILSVRNDDILLPNGNPAIREVVEHSGGSAVYCEKDGKILLVKQFRYPYNEELYEIPAGKLNEGETPQQTALRELEEEGGIIAKKVEKLFDVYPTPAYNNEIIRIFKAQDFVLGKIKLDEDEFLSGEWIEKEEVLKMVNDGRIKDAKTIIAILSQVK